MLFLGVMGARVHRADPPEALIVCCGTGDEDALRELYTQTRAAVFGFALSILKNRHDAEDVTQDTYLQVCAAASGYRKMGKPMAWILTITKNLSLMKMRQARREAPFEPLDVGESPPEPEEGIVLRAAMRVLSDEERQIVILHALSGLKHREIAGLLGLPLSTVLSKYQRALGKLRKQLEGGATREEPGY